MYVQVFNFLSYSKIYYPSLIIQHRPSLPLWSSGEAEELYSWSLSIWERLWFPFPISQGGPAQIWMSLKGLRGPFLLRWELVRWYYHDVREEKKRYLLSSISENLNPLYVYFRLSKPLVDINISTHGYYLHAWPLPTIKSHPIARIAILIKNTDKSQRREEEGGDVLTSESKHLEDELSENSQEEDSTNEMASIHLRLPPRSSCPYLRSW